MPPNNTTFHDGSVPMRRSMPETIDYVPPPQNLKPKPQRQQIKWSNVINITLYHVIAVYGLYQGFSYCQYKTIAWGFFIGIFSGFGVTAGAHRLWAHRSYKAAWPLRALLFVCFSTAGQNSIFDWVRDHRVHHKFSETDADPHNANRGFFFSHVGWLMMTKHPDVIEKGGSIDLSDVLNDSIVRFDRNYFVASRLVFCYFIPVFVPWWFWGESFLLAFIGPGIGRHACTLNTTWLVNSAAHMFGNKPYHKTISPAQNLSVAALALGEGWHNYHHVFPWDYKTAELGDYSFNLTAGFIDFFAWLGWATDLKTVNPDLIRMKVLSTGDGTHPVWKAEETSDE